jgi:TRAP-type transport system periplasmic protein
MLKIMPRWAFIAIAFFSTAALADPIKLKLAFISSDREMVYIGLIKPFLDAVNANAKGVFEIDPYTSGKLGRSLARQVQLVRFGVADIAFVNPTVSTDLFPDDMIMQLPDLFNNTREATTTYTRLATSGAFDGYQDFFVIGAIASLPVVINSRVPIVSLDDLKGKRVRATGAIESAIFKTLGIIPMEVPYNEVSSAISSGTIDAAAISVGSLFDFGISRVTSYHFFAPLGAVPLTLLMNRKKFDSLPTEAQDVIRKHSGEWLAQRYIDAEEKNNLARIEQLKSDPARKVIFPAQWELDAIRAASKPEIEKWATRRPRNSVIRDLVQNELARAPSTQ